MADQTEKKKGFFASVKERVFEFGRFFRDIKSEMKKVVWPTKKHVINNTIIVTVVVAIAAIILSLLDLIFGFGLGMFLQTAV